MADSDGGREFGKLSILAVSVLPKKVFNCTDDYEEIPTLGIKDILSANGLSGLVNLPCAPEKYCPEEI
jgi:hypothetical protein